MPARFLRITLLALGSALAVAAPLHAQTETRMNQDPLASVRPHSVTLSVSDLERSARWYADKLGLREVQRKEYPEFGTSLVFLERDGFRVELIRDGNAQAGASRADPPAHTSVFGISQFAFRTDDLAALRAELVRRGVPITWEFENADLGVRFLFVRDPDGNLIQFLQPLR